MMTTHHRFSTAILILLFLSAASAADDCVYTLYVKTGSIIKAGTDSKISITLGDASGKSVYIPDLEAVGLMGPSHDYFERTNLDIFTVKAPCIGSPLCRINVTSDGSGAHHGWDCDYVEVTSTGPTWVVARLFSTLSSGSLWKPHRIVSLHFLMGVLIWARPGRESDAVVAVLTVERKGLWRFLVKEEEVGLRLLYNDTE